MRVSVITHPNSRKPRIEKDLFGKIHVFVNQPALEGRANQATLESLAKFFQIKKCTIKLISGSKSKQKVFEIINPTKQEIF
ncbi:MAG: DUF167 domain-containing protein [Patescibacteria group bacterium]